MPDPTPRTVTVTAICLCGTTWTSRHLSVHPSRTVRIPTCPACQPDVGPAADTATDPENKP